MVGPSEPHEPIAKQRRKKKTKKAADMEKIPPARAQCCLHATRGAGRRAPLAPLLASPRSAPGPGPCGYSAALRPAPRRTQPRRRNPASQHPGDAAIRLTARARRPQVDFEREIADKAAELAERLRRDEEELEDSLRRRKEAAVENFSQIVQSTLVQVGGLYAVSQACLLAIFVPQRCPMIVPCSDPPLYTCDGVVDGIDKGLRLDTLTPDVRAQFVGPDAPTDWISDCCLTSSLFTYTTFSPDGHLCTMKENLDWENCSAFNQSVLVLNLVTLFIMLMAQSFFWKREVWMINHLEEDNTVPYSSLPEQIQPYEELEQANKGYNRTAFAYACAVMLSVMCNFGVSTYFLIKGDEFYNYNIGSRTITGLLTNTMLVSTKVIGYVSYARLSKTHDWAISMFSVIPVSYNVVDETYALNHAKPEAAPL